MPLATTENEAVWPCVTVRLCGGVVIPGGTLTVTVATTLVMLPPRFVTTAA